MLSTEDVLEESACAVKFENGALLARLFTRQQMSGTLYLGSYYLPSLSRRSGPAALKPVRKRATDIT
jgi:hypothetical protein